MSEGTLPAEVCGWSSSPSDSRWASSARIVELLASNSSDRAWLPTGAPVEMYISSVLSSSSRCLSESSRCVISRVILTWARALSGACRHAQASPSLVSPPPGGGLSALQQVVSEPPHERQTLLPLATLRRARQG